MRVIRLNILQRRKPCFVMCRKGLTAPSELGLMMSSFVANKKQIMPVSTLVCTKVLNFKCSKYCAIFFKSDIAGGPEGRQPLNQEEARGIQHMGATATLGYDTCRADVEVSSTGCSPLLFLVSYS